MQKDWFAVFKIPVRAHIIKTWLFLPCFLNCRSIQIANEVSVYLQWPRVPLGLQQGAFYSTRWQVLFSTALLIWKNKGLISLKDHHQQVWQHAAFGSNFVLCCSKWDWPHGTCTHLSLLAQAYVDIQTGLLDKLLKLPVIYTRSYTKKEKKNLLVQCSTYIHKLLKGGDVAQLVERRTSTLLRQVQFPGAARDFSPSQFSVQTFLRCLYSPFCANAYFNICAHIQDPKHWQPYLRLVAWKYHTHHGEWVALLLRLL